MSPDERSAELKSLQENAVEELRTRISAIEGDRAEKLIQLVDSRRRDLPLSSGITDQLVGISKQILTFGAAGLALAVGFREDFQKLPFHAQQVVAAVGVFYLELMVLSLLLLVVYAFQARFRYPFLTLDQVGNAWPFFYYATLSRDIPRSPFLLEKQRVLSQKRYAEDFKSFTEKVVGESVQERLANEIRQYFLLLNFQAYQHQFGLQLGNIFLYGFVGAVCCLVALVAWSAIR